MNKESVYIDVPEILPPSEDGVFKTLLTHHSAKPCLRDIIASIIGLPIMEITVRNTELPISDMLEKRERFDVNCEIDGGDQVEVEMQTHPMEGDSLPQGHKNIKDRSIFNVCDLHSNQKGVGIPYGSWRGRSRSCSAATRSLKTAKAVSTVSLFVTRKGKNCWIQ
jgi:hypothetical protein